MGTLHFFASAQKKMASACKYVISTHDDDYSYLRGNIIRGENLFPFAAALVLVWDTFAMSLGVEKKKLSVQFRDVRLHSQPILHEQRQLRLNVTIQQGVGRFEVMDENIKVIAGYISTDISNKRILDFNSEVNDNIQLSSKDVYQLLHSRYYNYQGDFRSIHGANLSLTKAQIIWENNWVTFVDALLQLNTLRCNQNIDCMPEAISKITIDVEEHLKFTSNTDKESFLIADVFKQHDCTRCGGVVIEHIKYQNMSPKEGNVVSLHSKKFVPHFSNNDLNELTVSYVFLQIAAENLRKNNLSVVEILNDDTSSSAFTTIRDISNEIYGIRTQYSFIYKENILEQSKQIKDADIVLVTNLSSDKNLCQILYALLERNCLLINKDLHMEKSSNNRSATLYRSISAHIINDVRTELVIWRPTDSCGTSVYTVRSSSDLTYISSLVPTIPLEQKIYLLASHPLVKGLGSLVKEWRKERKIYLAIINQGSWDDKLLNEIVFKDIMTNVYKKGVWGGEYILPLEKKSILKRTMMLECARADDFDSIHWVEAPEKDYSGIDVDVHYAGINLVYIKQETGVIGRTNTHKNLKVDFSGITKRGERVMGIAHDQVICTSVKAQPEMLWPVPAHWTLEDAATVPLAYCIAIYCLLLKVRLVSGQRILVHGGAGALGQAILSIALAFNCEVFVTVSDMHKKQFLKRLFPQLRDDHIGNSCDHSFGDMVLSSTKGEGCDVVIGCVEGELKNTALKCCATSGTTLDTALLHNREDFTFGMHNLTKCRSYVTVNLSTILDDTEQLFKLQALVSEGIARGYVRPLSRVTFPAQEAPRAFRLLAARRHRGRILLDLRHHALNVVPRLKCSSEMLQLIISIDDDLGIQLAERLASRGASSILLYCEKVSNIHIYKQRFWKEEGVNIQVLQGNINSYNIVNLINENIKKCIEGIYLCDVITAQDQCMRELLEEIPRLAPKLKHFAIANTGTDIHDEEMCNSGELPLIWIKLPTLDKFDSSEKIKVSKEGISTLAAIDVVEKALSSNEHLVIARKESLPRISVMNQITRILGANILEDSENTLRNLGIDWAKSEAIRVYLRNEYNISLSNQDVLSLTVKAFKQLEENIDRKSYADVDGFKSFFSYIDSDEIRASTEIIFLPTLTNTNYSDCEFDKSQAYMCVVPGVEGHHERFRIMCERLKLPAVVLQPGLNKPRESLQDLASRYVQILLKKTGLQQKFYLLGYESGVIIAMKMAEILESHGLSGTVFCIGGSPHEIKELFHNKLSIYNSEATLQNALLLHLTSLLMETNGSETENKIEACETWDDKLLTCLRILKRKIPHSTQYLKFIIESAYVKVLQVLQYEFVPHKLKSNIICLRPSSKISTGTTLQEYSEQPVVQYNLNTSLACITQDLRCSSIINRHVGEDVLKDFQNRNLCETYCVKSVTFLK